MVSKAHVRLKYGKSAVEYGKSIILCGNVFLAPTVPLAAYFHLNLV